MNTPSANDGLASRIGRPATDLLWVVGGFALLAGGVIGAGLALGPPAVLQALRGTPDEAKPVKIRQSRNAESR